VNKIEDHSAVSDSHPGLILVADDEEKNRRLLRDLLEAQGHVVLLANDGQQALDITIAEMPDTVLLDVMMPKLDGFEVCRQLRCNPATAHIPILLVTALRERPDRVKGIQAGANDFLTKPIDAEEIRLRVRNAVYAKRLHDKVQQDLTKLRELEMLRDNLMHMIVHDLRSPITVISGACDAVMMMDKDRLSSTQQEFITMAQNSCRDLIEMVSSLLDVSRMEAGEMPLNRVPCNIRDIAQKAADSVAVLAQGKKLTIQVGGDSAGVAVDRDIMHRVFVNLLGNAIKFSPEGGTIGIAISSTGKTVRATVTDQGRGVPPEYHKKIFEKFGQVASRQENKKYSTGLGLTFCKLAVEAHGGQIGVESTVGQGSTFWFTIPKA
jgi:signal transduction histidine kinase